MTSLTITPNPDISRLLVAGRKAACVALCIKAHDQGHGVTGPGMDDYDGKCELQINGVDIGQAIDAAVLEVVVQIGNPEAPASRPPLWCRGFSILLRSYMVTVAVGLPILLGLLIWRVWPT